MKFKIFSTEVIISYLLICFAAICVISGVFEGFICCLISVMIHETGHITAMCVFRFAPDKIKISLFEISINDNSRHKRTFWQNLIIIFFGPFFNFICFIMFYLLYLKGNDEFYPFAIANLTNSFNTCSGLFISANEPQVFTTPDTKNRTSKI